MRLHHLRATAFGPFAGTVEVDFDALGEAGLFLLTGATGAGKTSVLDAVCFGLYGEVPGDRHAARHLRSDHAAPDLPPEVCLTFSVSGRTLRLTRSPAWDRPRRRRPGTTRQPARVVAEELVGGDWQALTTRLDDAGLLVGGVLGMTCTQFTQVAMLPQGRFQAFLRASSADRHEVLQRLFRTDRFERVEQWLVDRRLHLRRQGDLAHDRVAGLVHRLQEAAEQAVPEDWDLHDLGAPADDGRLAQWVAATTTEAGSQARTAAEVARVAALTASAAQECRRDADQLADRQRRGRRARAELAGLDAGRPAADAAADRLAAHRRAQPVTALLDRVRTCSESLTHATAVAQDARTAAGLADLVEAAQVEAMRLDAVRAGTAAEALLPRARELERIDARLTHLRAARVAAEADLAALAETAAAQAALRADTADRLADARAAAGRLPELRAAHDRARAGREAAATLLSWEADLEAARADLQSAVDQAQLLRDRYQDAREERIAAMAGELAGALAVGCACPVCGSTDHPTPAAAGTATERAHEEDARRAYEDADVVRLARAEALAALEARIEAIRPASDGGSAATWAGRQAAVEAELHEVERGAAEVAALEDRAAALAEEAARRQRREATATATLAAGTDETAELQRRAQVLAAEVATAVGPHATLDAAVAHHADRAATLTDLATAIRTTDEAAAALADATAGAEAAARRAGFADAADAAAAVLDAAEVTRVEDDLAERARNEAAARAVLADPDVADAVDAPVPDLAEVTATADAATEELRRAEVEAVRRQRRVDRVRRLAAELDHELEAWRPAREQLALVAGLAAFAEGKSSDNALRMRLSAYVLAERLRQVVAAANVRLARMSGQRYSLEHSDERGVGAQRGGLSLLVRDDWSGVLRDPATLSGGETFVVSLALALGLADTVCHEAGGTAIETLFVDEGFGSLDADTLEDVMDVLDGLREGGRVIGVVSHVAELRDRITTQLEVRKGRRGSEVCAH